jgi:hypothetical protein
MDFVLKAPMSHARRTQDKFEKGELDPAKVKRLAKRFIRQVVEINDTWTVLRGSLIDIRLTRKGD